MTARTEPLLRHIRRLAAPPEAPADDAALLDRFVRRHDEAAFAALVARHGSMVLGVCRRILRDLHEAEDVCQATFLVLAKKAGSLRHPDTLAAWLHVTARHLALKCRRAGSRRHEREERRRRLSSVATTGPLDEITARELLAVLDEEVQHLPEAYRVPLVLCYLEGRTQEEAAQLLGWTPGSVKGRLERGRAGLQARLARRGLTLGAALLAAHAFRGAASATAFRAGGASARAVLLAETALRKAATAKVGLALALAVALTGAGVLAHQALATKPPPAETGKRAEPAPPHAARPGGDRHGDPLPSEALVRMGAIRFRHIKDATFVAFSPDGKVLATGERGTPIILWDAATGEELRRFTAEFPFPTGRPVFSPDGKRLATVSWEVGGVRLWDVVTGEEGGRLKVGEPLKLGSGPPLSGCLAFSPDGKGLAIPDGSKNIHLFDVAAGTKIRQFQGHPEEIASLAFSVDGQTLAAGGEGKTIVLWETATGRQIRQLAGHEKQIPSVAFSADGKELASASRDCTVRLWDLATGRQRRRFTFEVEKGRPEWDGMVQTVLFVPGTRWLVAGGIGSIRIWDLATGREVRRLPGHWGLVDCPMAVSPDGKKLAATWEHGQVILRDMATGERLCEPEGHQRAIASVAFSPDGKTLASGSMDKTLRLWDTAGKERRRLSLPSCVHAVFSPDGKLLAGCCNDDGFIRIWDAATGEERRRFQASKGWIIRVVFSPDGQTLASVGRENVIRLWRVDTGAEVRRLAGQQEVMEVAFAPDGRTLASVGWDRTARLWDVVRGEEVRQFRGHQGVLHCVAFSPDGATVAAAGDDKRIHLWKAATGAAVGRLVGHEGEGWVEAVRFSPDGRTLASGGPDFTVRLWEVATGQERQRFLGHRNKVGALDFSADGRRLASGGSDAIILVWDATGGITAEHEGPAPLPEKELARLWTELGDAKDAARAHRAMRTLLGDPAGAVRLFRQQLRPVPAAEGARIARWIADLDSDDFAVRDRAMMELARSGVAEAALRKALEGRPSLEVRQRLNLVLERLDRTAMLRSLRAVEVLEHLGTAEARQVLQALAAGAPAAGLTQDARASLARLAVPK